MDEVPETLLLHCIIYDSGHLWSIIGVSYFQAFDGAQSTLSIVSKVYEVYH